MSCLPDDIPLDQVPGELPELPEGYVWGIKVTAEAEVIKAGTVEANN